MPSVAATKLSINVKLTIAKTLDGEKKIVLRAGKKVAVAKAVKIKKAHGRTIVAAVFKLKDKKSAVIWGSLLGRKFFYGSVFGKKTGKG